MIPPYGQVADTVNRAPDPGGEHRQRPVMVQAHHRHKPARVQVGRIFHCDQGIGIGRVADDEDLDVPLRMLVQCPALYAEDFGIAQQQVCALHSRTARPGADQDGKVRIFESDVGVSTGHHPGQRRKSAVIQFHHYAVQCRQRRWDLKKLQDHRLILTQQLSGGNPEQQGITDLTGCPRHGNPYRGFHFSSALQSVRNHGSAGRYTTASDGRCENPCPSSVPSTARPSRRCAPGQTSQ